MRGVLLSLAFMMAVAVAAPQAAAPLAPAGHSISALSTSFEQSVPKEVNVDINVNRGADVGMPTPCGSRSVRSLLSLFSCCS